MQTQCEAAAAALGIAENPTFKSFVASLNEGQLGQLSEIFAAVKAGASSSTGNLNVPENPHAEAANNAFVTIPNVACLEPRGRWDVLFSEDSVLFRNKKGVVQKVRMNHSRNCFTQMHDHTSSDCKRLSHHCRICASESNFGKD